MEDKVLKIVFDFFVKSSDFNGIPIVKISEKLKIDYLETIEVLKNLLSNDLISVQSSVNPHIISLGDFTNEKQIDILEDAKKNIEKSLPGMGEFIKFSSHPVCIYPSKQYLLKERDISKFSKSPYSEQLALAEAHLKPVFFEIEILERYLKDPRFSFEFEDYSGQISYHVDENEKPIVKENDEIFLKTFGLGVDLDGNRVAVAYLRYLHGLTPEHQQFWKSKEIDFNRCKMRKEYYDNTIEGNWTKSYSIFSAFLGEQKAVNDLTKEIFNVSLFVETFENNKRPKEFTFFMIPTLSNYHDFISLLDKMISENINRKIFEDQVELYELRKIDENTSERITKGTLRLFEEWLPKIYNLHDKDLADEILFKPFKQVRKERQSPAHKINSNVYDKALFEKQRENLTSYNKNKNTSENHTLIYAYDNAPSLNETIYKALFGDKYFYALICYPKELTITPRFSKNMLISSTLEKTKARIGILSDSVTTEYNSNNMPIKSTNNQSVNDADGVLPRFLIVETFFYE